MKIPFSIYDFFGYLSGGCVVLATIDYSFQLNFLLQEKIPLQFSVLLTIMAYIIGHLIANFSSFFFEIILLRKILGSPEIHLFIPEKNVLKKMLFPQFYKTFPKDYRDKILTKALKEGYSKPDRSLFFHCHSIAQKQNENNGRLSTFLQLYGFSRNLSFTFMVCSALLFWKTKFAASPPNINLVMSVSLIFSIGLFYRYLKFFKHYTEEVFRIYETN